MNRGDLVSVIEPILGSGQPLEPWLHAHLDAAKARLAAEGALILRGFSAEADETAENVLAALDGELLDDAFWSTPRKGVSRKTFTATEMASDRAIALHSEMSYMSAWPRLLAFHALEVAEDGGATTVCNLDEASVALGDLLTPFSEKGVLYRRCYHNGIDVPWKTAFRTEDRDEVADIAAKAGMEIEWLPGNVLLTEHRAQGCVEAENGAILWFNQSHVFHPANQAPAAQAQLVQLLGADRLPRQSYYGDRSVILPEIVARVTDVFNSLTHEMRWQRGDVIILDNLRFAHGRMPFKGTRRLHVAMANSQSTPRRTPLFSHV